MKEGVKFFILSLTFNLMYRVVYYILTIELSQLLLVQGKKRKTKNIFNEIKKKQLNIVH